MTKYQEFLIHFKAGDLVYSTAIEAKLSISKNHAKQIVFWYKKKWLLKPLYKNYYIFWNQKPSDENIKELWCQLSKWYLWWEYILSENNVINTWYSNFFTFFTLKKDFEIRIKKFDKKLVFYHHKYKKLFFYNKWLIYKENYTYSDSTRAMIDIYINNKVLLCDIKIEDLKERIDEYKEFLSLKTYKKLCNDIQNTKLL